MRLRLSAVIMFCQTSFNTAVTHVELMILESPSHQHAKWKVQLGPRVKLCWLIDLTELWNSFGKLDAVLNTYGLTWSWIAVLQVLDGFWGALCWKPWIPGPGSDIWLAFYWWPILPWPSGSWEWLQQRLQEDGWLSLCQDRLSRRVGEVCFGERSGWLRRDLQILLLSRTRCLTGV